MEEIRAGCNCLPQAHCCKKENSDPNISFSPDYIDFDNLFLCLHILYDDTSLESIKLGEKFLKNRVYC